MLGAPRAGGEVHLERGAAILGQIPLDVVEELDVLWMGSRHHVFD
jgi:hypothetical protein